MNLGPGSTFNQLTLPSVSIPLPMTLPPLSNIIGGVHGATAFKPVITDPEGTSALARASDDIAEIMRQEQEAML